MNEITETTEEIQLETESVDAGADRRVESEPADQQPPETTTPPTDESVSAPDAVSELREMLAEAEMRGYRRGINEQLSRALRQPGLFQDLARTPLTETTTPSRPDDPMTSRFLQSVRPGIWD